MKKSQFFIIVSIVLGIIFNSCSPYSYKNSIRLTNAHVYILGIEDFVLPNIHSFSFKLSTDSVSFDTITNTFMGSGYGLEINLLSYTNEYIFPITTQSKSTAPFSDRFFIDPTMLEPGKCAVNIHRIVDGKSVETIEPDKFDIVFDKKSNWEEAEIRIKTTIDGQPTAFVFKGKLTTTDISYYGLQQDNIEPEVINEEITFTENDILYDVQTFWFGNSMNTICVSLYSDEYMAFFTCYSTPENRQDVYGTYTVSQEHTIGTAAQSPGVDTYGDEDEYLSAFPSFVARWNEETEKEEYFLVKEGSITIKENEVQFGVKTQNGSKIKGKYNGELYIERDIIYYDAPNSASKSLKKIKQKQFEK